MAEIFKPRANMVCDGNIWKCLDKTGKYICDGGPSIIWEDGEWEFYVSHTGNHRLDGPALFVGEWYIKNENVTRKIHEFAEENDIDLNNLSDVDKVLIALRFG